MAKPIEASHVVGAGRRQVRLKRWPGCLAVLADGAGHGLGMRRGGFAATGRLEAQADGSPRTYALHESVTSG